MMRKAKKRGGRDGSPGPAAGAIASALPGNPAWFPALAGWTVLVLLLMSGCTGAGRTVVLRPSESSSRYTSVLVREHGHDPFVPSKVRRDFGTALAVYLYDRGPFVHGPELRIVYRVTGYPAAGEEVSSEGKKDAGTKSVTAEVKFYNFVGQEIASIRAESDAGNWGSTDGAVRECARQVALYAEQNFR